MENDENNSFNITGFPLNTPFEVDAPDDKQRAIKRGMPSNMMMQELQSMSPDKIMKMLPKETIENLKEQAEAQGVDFDSLLESAASLMNNLTSTTSSSRASIEDLLDQLDEMIEESFDNLGLNDGENSDEDSEPSYEYLLGGIDYLDPARFGSIPMYKSNTLYEDFVDIYGSDPSKYLDDQVGVKDFIVTSMTSNLLLNNEIDTLKYIVSDENAIVFYAVPKDSNKYGFFIAAVKTAADKFTIFIPEFSNTFKLNRDGSTGLFGPLTEPKFFECDDNGDYKFRHLNMDVLMFSIRWCLAPKSSVILSPKRFGTIRNVIAPITAGSSMLKVGNITSNESPEAILFKKDADIPLDNLVFPFYIKFKNVESEETLKLIQQILFKVNFNEAAILDYCELKWTNDHKLYIEIDLGEF